MIASLLLALVAAEAPPPIAPAGPWYVRTEQDMCLLERQYPTAKGQVALVFQPMLDLPTMEVFVIGNGGGQQYQGNFTATAGAAAFTGRYLSLPAKGGQRRITRLSIDRRMMDGLKDGDRLRIQAKRSIWYSRSSDRRRRATRCRRARPR